METITMAKNNFKMAAICVEVPNERKVEYPHFSKVNFKKKHQILWMQSSL
jgi:hypothetical protein